MQYFINRFKERSTWQGLAAIATAFGVTLKPELQEAIITAGIAIAALLHVAFPETVKVEEVKK